MTKGIVIIFQKALFATVFSKISVVSVWQIKQAV